MDEKKSLWQEFTKGIIKENPVLRLILGCCATLAVTTAASNAIGMGAATTFVLVCSNAAISLLRNIIPNKVRIPAFITIIAGFVTVVQLFIKAFSPALDTALGVFLPLIVVNCIILGRAEMFASKNTGASGRGHGFRPAHSLRVYGAHHHLPAAPGGILRVRHAHRFGGQALERGPCPGVYRVRPLPLGAELLEDQ